jgi:hypothetical protein
MQYTEVFFLVLFLDVLNLKPQARILCGKASKLFAGCTLTPPVIVRAIAADF